MRSKTEIHTGGNGWKCRKPQYFQAFSCFNLFFLLFAPALTAQTPFPAINEAIATGAFTQAQQLIGERIAGGGLSPAQVYGLELESALLDRIRLDFNRDEAYVRETLKPYYPELSAEQLAKWETSGELEMRLIDGEKRYFRNAVWNLFRVNEAAKKRREEVDGPRENELGQQIVTLHDHVNNRLRVVGGSGPESKASEFLSQGVGRCYAHTLAFAALGRGIGIPGRAIGGLRIDRGQMRQGEVGEHTWNQIYVPGPGWVDVDTQLDDDPEGDHRRSYIGYRNNSRWVTFVGEYDQRDDRTVFTERSWYRTYRWRSTTGPRARVRAEGPEITSSDLRHW